METLDLPIRLVGTPPENVPAYAKPGDAGADLRCTHPVRIDPGCFRPIPTGVHPAIPPGHCGLIVGRSGLACRGILILGGLLDSGFRGEVNAILFNAGPQPIEFGESVGPDGVIRWDRVAQLVILPIAQAKFRIVDSLDATERGEGGLGHTGR